MDVRQMQRQLVEILEAHGWEYDDARAFAMGVAAPSTETGFDAPAPMGADVPAEAAALINQIRAAFEPIREERKAEQQAAEKRVAEAVKRIDDGTHTNTDLWVVVRAGLAEPVYDDPESERPTSIRWIEVSPWLTHDPYKGIVEG